MIRIAFRYISPESWQGGFNYLLNLCSTLKRSKQERLAPVMMAGPSAGATEAAEPFKHLLGDDFRVDDAFERSALRRRQFVSFARGYDTVALKSFDRHNVDVVFENADFYGTKFRLPTVAWIPDLQHKYLPHLFPKIQLYRREIGFRLQLKHRAIIMVSSEDAKSNLIELYRVDPARVYALPFAVPFTAPPTTQRISETRRKYDLPAKYLFLPNQLYRHKNHLNVAKAVHQLVSQGMELTVVCTGGTGNQAGKAVLQELNSYVASADIGSRFRILGRIPSSDLITLFSNAHAMINPSLFEGWSTTIEEAKSLEIPMLLSDLPVNREQAGTQATFFDPLDVSSIAQAIAAGMQSAHPTRRSLAELRETADNRLAEFADRFENIVLAAYEGRVRPIC